MFHWKRGLALLLLSGAAFAASAVAKKPTKKREVLVRAEHHNTQVARSWLKRMPTLRERVAQLVVIPFYGQAPNTRSKAWRDFVREVRDTRVGGLVIINRSQNGVVKNAEPYETAAFLNRMQRLAKTPLIVAGDFERGASMRMANTTKFPHLMAFGAAGDPELTRRLGQATARESRALGFQWIFAPVADVNSNPDNPIINIRSFGEDPRAVSEHVKAFIEGVHGGGKSYLLTTLKHFPGHGDTAVDSHLGLAKLDHSRTQMDAVELMPFRAGFQAGADAVMTAHMAVPAVEQEEIPATVSKNVLTGLLRKEMGFQGIVVTDAMDMQGLTNLFPSGEAAVRALEAGADILLMPTKPEEAINAVVAAVQKGRLERKRVEESVLRVLAAKAQAGLNKKKLVDLESINEEVDSPEAGELAQQVADRAVTLVKNNANAVPLKHPETACYYVLSESRYSLVGRKTADELRSRVPRASVFLMEPFLPRAAVDDAVQRAGNCSAAVVFTFVTATAYRGSVSLSGVYPTLMEGLLKGKAPVVMISLGNPYLLRSHQGVSSYLTTFSTAPPSETAAVKALFGEIAIQGKMPVSIPGLAKVGDGLQVPAKAALR